MKKDLREILYIYGNVQHKNVQIYGSSQLSTTLHDDNDENQVFIFLTFTTPS